MGLYLAFDLFYSYSFYKDVYYYDCSGMTSESWVYLESEYNNDFGIEPQIGYKLWLLKKSRVKFIFDFYTGIGFLINLQEHITFGQGYGCYINRFEYFTRPRETKKTRLAPDVVLGVNFEIAF
ncbi:MAG: hypothetical protein KQH67_01885 [Bacteroidetes bacterium]|nr:hypothetical protein [Bacteroidota bacterium]